MPIQQKTSYGFVAGEVSPDFYGRTDLTKYDLGLRLSYNFFVNTQGGISSRAGTEFCAPIEADDKPVKLFRFRATADDYFILFGEKYFRPIRDGGYLLHPTKAITGIVGNVVTSAGHGYVIGDWVFVSGIVGATEFNLRYFEIVAANANTFTLALPNGGTLDSSGYGAYVSGGLVAKTVRIDSPYSAEFLPGLSFEQRYNDVVLTSLAYPRYRMTYVTDTNWTISAITSSGSFIAPTGLALTPSGAGTAGVAFAVTAIIDGKETVASAYKTTETTVNYGATAGSMKVTWNALAGATEYYIYRSLLLPIGADITLAQELGYLGRSFGPQFTDTNITPDFTKTPPLYYSPFAPSTIEQVDITVKGSGYAKSATVVITDPTGSGFDGYPIVNAAGQIVSVVVVNGGSDYTAPVVSFIGGGTLAAATATIGPASGVNPRIFKVFQQRGVYAGTDNLPMTLFASRPGELDNMDVSSVPTAGDGYEFTIDSAEIKPILHLLALRFGLLIFTENSVTLLRAEEGKAVSGVNALAEPQAYRGAGEAPPTAIDLDVIFAQSKGSSVNAMLYTEYTNTFKLQDLAVLSNHFFCEGRKVVRFAWVEEPHKLLYCLREDGALITLTYDREQEVFGWSQQWTQGLFTDCCAGTESQNDVLYVVVKRRLSGNWVQTVERVKSREHRLPEDFWCVDCGQEYPLTSPAATLTPSAITGTGISLTTNVGVFSASNVGDIVYLGEGKAEVVTYVSPTEITVDFLRDMSLIVPETTATPQELPSGAWQIGTPITVVSGLWHLEGESVSVLADGDAFLEKVVTAGKITLDHPATKIKVGLGYRCRGKTLPIALRTVQSDGKIKDIVGVSVRVKDTRGLAVGADFDSLVEMKDRTSEDWGDELLLRQDMSYVSLNTAWDTEGSVCFEQRYPLPATVLSLVHDVNLGDD